GAYTGAQFLLVVAAGEVVYLARSLVVDFFTQRVGIGALVLPTLITYSSCSSICVARYLLDGGAYQEHCVYEYDSLQSRRLRQGQPQGVGPDLRPVYQEGPREEGLLGRAGSRAGRPGGVRMDSFRGRSCSRDCGTAAFDGRRP